MASSKPYELPQRASAKVYLYKMLSEHMMGMQASRGCGKAVVEHANLRAGLGVASRNFTDQLQIGLCYDVQILCAS